MYLFLAGFFGLSGCGEPEPAKEDSEDTQDGACGDASYWDITVRAKVQDEGGSPLADMAVELDDESTGATGALGSGTTNPQGLVELLATGVEFREGCVGTLYDYQTIVTDPAGIYGEAKEEMDSNLYNATIDGTLIADITNVPIVMTPL